MKYFIQIFFIMPLFISINCVTLYKPNAVFSPLLKEKGDLNTSASLGLSGTGLINLQAAYAITNHMGLMANGMYHTRRINSDDASVEKLKILFSEVGAGYFLPFGTDEKGLFQCYGGAGYGKTTDVIKNTIDPNPEVNAKYFNLFIQPGISYSKANFDGAFDVRMNYVNLYNIDAFLYDQFEFWNTNFQYYSDTSLYFINLEPTITLRAGREKLKGVFQLGATIPIVKSKSYFAANSPVDLGLSLVKISFGISYYIKRHRKVGLIYY